MYESREMSRSNKKKMKRKYIGLEDICENLYLAEAMAGSGIKARRPAVIEYRKNLKENLENLKQRLLDGTYEPDPGHTFEIVSQGKHRLIHTVNYEARIVDQLVVNVLAPHMTRRYVRRTYGCIEGRGCIKASMQLRRDMRHTNYFIKGDVSKYYPSIRRDLMMYFIRRIVKGEKFLHLVESVLNAYQNTTLPDMLTQGLSIGSLKSQHFGNFFLTVFDYFVLQVLKVKYYVRYVDDIILLFKSKAQARRVAQLIKEFMRDKLHLTLAKIRIAPLGRQIIDFCMFQHRVDHQGRVYTFLRKSTLIRFRRKLNFLRRSWRLQCFASISQELAYIAKERSSVCSYLGALKFCNSKQLLIQLQNQYHDIFTRIQRCAKGARRRPISNFAAA